MSEESDARAYARVGATLNDKWTLERLLGIGGMAAVYAGKHRNGARAAVKVLHPDISKIQEARERFIREGYAANSVEHPGVVKVLDDDVVSGGEDDGTAYLVMELLEGESLEDRIERGPLMKDDELLPIMKSVLEVLEAAHGKGIIHRDLKPENLFLAKMEDGSTRLKVLDFGLARMQERSIQTVHGLALGTPSYMPPEQAAGRITQIDGRSDLFALGASCFRLLAGRSVHPGSNALEIVMKMAKEPAPKLRSVAPYVSEAVAAIIDRALAFERDARYPDAAAMLADVDAVLGNAPRDPEPAPVPEPAPKPESKPLPMIPVVPSVQTSWPQGVPRQRSILPLLAVLALGGVAAWLTWDTFFTSPPSPREADSALVGDATQTDVETADSAMLDAEITRDAGGATADTGVITPLSFMTDASADAADAGKEAGAKDGGAKEGGIKDAGIKDAGKPKPKPSSTVKPK